MSTEMNRKTPPVLGSHVGMSGREMMIGSVKG